jgi:RNA polymerase sigma-70 factor (ECF subfamily)
MVMTEVGNNHQTQEQMASEMLDIQAAQKNSASFEVLYNRYFETVVRFIYQRVDTKDEAFEIAQQVFLKALLSIQKYTYKGVPFSAWLFRIAINEMNMYFRANKATRAVNVDVSALNYIADEIKDEVTEERHGMVAKALTKLPEEDLMLIEMRFFEKRAFKEIGAILNITEANAKARLYRVIEKMKSILKIK